MKQIILFFTIFIILSSCKGQEICNQLEIGLRDNQIQNYLHPEIENRKLLIFEENEYCNPNIDDLNGIKVITVSKDEITNYTNCIFINNFTVYDDYTLIRLNYPIEGTSFEIKIFNNNIVKTKIIET